MNEAYRQEELRNANRQYTIARAKWAIAKTAKERYDWSEKMEFWGNKAAFLEHAR
jgi:hypothetical protein